MNTSDDDGPRKTAIHLLRSGCPVEQVASELKHSASWVYKWQARFEQTGWAGLQSRSRARKEQGQRLSTELQQAIRQARSELEAVAAAGSGLRFIGPAAVRARLQEQQVAPLPSTASIGRVLRLAGMTRRPRSRLAAVKYPHLQPSQAHELVQVDIVPHFLTGGEAVACFNAIDVASRYPTGQPFSQRRAQDAVAFLGQVWQEIGLARYTQVDNEGCFSGGFSHPGVLGQVVRAALWVGTELVFSPVRHPASNGTVERFHQDYDGHVWDQTDLTDRAAVASQSQTFFQRYRHSRHHSALGGRSPAEVHHQTPPRRLPADFTFPAGKLPLTVGRVHFIRQVSPAGTVSVLNLTWPVPKPTPPQGVWLTLAFSIAGATLAIYDAAPDVATRRRLASYPFPLKEKVKPRPDLNQTTARLVSQPWPLTLVPETQWRKTAVSLIAKTVRYTLKAALNFISTMC